MSNDASETHLGFQKAGATPSFRPIDTLPNEVLSSIFQEVVREASTTTEYPEFGELPDLYLAELHTVQYPETLARVSTMWYSIVTADARLWSFLALNTLLDLGPYSDLESYAGNRVLKSKDCTLTIRIGSYDSFEDVRRALEIATGAQGIVALRWKSLSIYYLTEDLCSFFLYPTPALMHLDCEIYPNCLTPRLSGTIFPFTPSLTSLRLSDSFCSLAHHRIHRQIKVLDLTLYKIALLPYLSEFPSLECLTLYVETDITEVIAESTNLPLLKTLIFSDPRDLCLISSLRLPALLHLQLGHRLNSIQNVDDHTRGVMLYLSTSLPSVRTLTFAGWHVEMGTTGMKDLIRALPGLEEFIAYDLSYGDGLYPKIFECFNDPMICPNLRICDMNEVSPKWRRS